MRIADEAMELHHVVIDVTPEGDVRLLQLAGRVPCRVDGAPVSADGTAAPVEEGAVVTLGSSRLRIGEGPAIPAGGSEVARTATAAPPEIDDAGTVVVPPAAGPAEPRGWVATAVAASGVVVSTVLALAPLLIAAPTILDGCLVAAAAVVAGALVLRASRARATAHVRDRAVLSVLRRELEGRRADWLADRRARLPGVAVALEAVRAVPEACWARTDADGGLFRVCLGAGPDRWEPDVIVTSGGPASPDALAAVAALAAVPDAPVEADLGPGCSMTITGAGAGGVARSIVVQLGAWVGPDQLRLQFSRDPPAWARALPHVVVPGQGTDGGDGRHVVCVVERADLLGRPPGAWRAVLGLAESAALVIVDEDGAASPGGDGHLELGELGTGRWRARPGLVAAREVHAAGLDARAAADAAEAIGRLGPRPPRLPPVRLRELAAARGHGPVDDPIGVAAAWQSPPARVGAWLGRAEGGVVTVDLDDLAGPLLVLGASPDVVEAVVALLTTSLAAQLSPEAVEIMAVRATGPSRPPPVWHQLPHVAGVVDVDDPDARSDLAAMMFDALEVPHPRGRRTVFVIDDDAAAQRSLAPALAAVAERGPGAGLHLVVMAAGRWRSPLTDAALAGGTALSIVLTLADEAIARRACGDTRPCRLGPDAAIVRPPGDRGRLVRLPVATVDREELAAWTGAIRHAAALSAAAGP